MIHLIKEEARKTKNLTEHFNTNSPCLTVSIPSAGAIFQLILGKWLNTQPCCLD